MEEDLDIAVIAPCYNEEVTIGGVIDGFKSVMKGITALVLSLDNAFGQATYCYHAGLGRRSLLIVAGGEELNKALRRIGHAVTGYEGRVFKPVD